MDFVAHSEPLVRVVFWIGLTALSLSLLTILLVVLQRISSSRRAARRQRFLAEWRPLLSLALAGEQVRFPTMRAGDLFDFLKLWLYYQESLRGDARRVLNNILSAQPAMRRLPRLLHCNSMQKRLLVVSGVGHLGMQEAWDDLASLLDKPTPLSLAAARSLCQIDAKRAAPLVTAQIIAHRDWSPAYVVNMLREAGDPLMDCLMDAINAAAEQQLPYLGRLMRLLEPLGYHGEPGFIEQALGHSDDATAIISALHLLKNPRQLPLAKRHLRHPDPQVRAALAQALGRLGNAADLADLRQLLAAPETAVRHEAARALMHAPFVDTANLNQIREAHDPARAALIQVEADLAFR